MTCFFTSLIALLASTSLLKALLLTSSNAETGLLRGWVLVSGLRQPCISVALGSLISTLSSQLSTTFPKFSHPLVKSALRSAFWSFSAQTALSLCLTDKQCLVKSVRLVWTVLQELQWMNPFLSLFPSELVPLSSPGSIELFSFFKEFSSISKSLVCSQSKFISLSGLRWDGDLGGVADHLGVSQGLPSTNFSIVLSRSSNDMSSSL